MTTPQTSGRIAQLLKQGNGKSSKPIKARGGAATVKAKPLTIPYKTQQRPPDAAFGTNSDRGVT